MHKYLLGLIIPYLPKYLKIFYDGFTAKSVYMQVGYSKLFKLGSEKGDLELIKWSLERKKMFKKKNKYVYASTPIMYYSYVHSNGNTEILQLLLEEGELGFHGACKSGNIEIINLIIEKGVGNWDSGLSGACEGGHMEIVNLMIEKGARNWDSGLRCACRGGHMEIVNLMMERISNPSPYDYGWALDAACEGGHMKAVRFMLEKGTLYMNNALYYACISGDMEIINLLIEKGADDWDSGLRGACRGGHMDIVESMIEKGANNIHTVSSYACSSGNLDVVKFTLGNKTRIPYDYCDVNILEYLSSLTPSPPSSLP